jgi:hypothetical protein
MEQRPRLGRRPLLLGFCFSLAIWLAVGLMVYAAQGLADEPTAYAPPSEVWFEPSPEGLPFCESAPDPLEDESVAAEVRSLRSDIAADCSALSFRLDEVKERLWWVTVELAEAGPQRALGNEKLSALVEGLEALNGSVGASGGLPVSVEGVTSLKPLPVHETRQFAVSTPIAESVNASGEALKGGVYFLAGLVVAAFVSYVFYRQVMPRA